MTAKEKADELITKYLIYFPEFRNDLEYDYNVESSKNCALIAVDELITYAHNNYDANYWEKVKEEIINL